ncbi:hypothetical protein BKA63DRAFT_513165 [Paraphoma chrysanthemicola]|nr:hypothetical protein BKA63DRAFT_513165 [Paraphoma chrysanthemicola]
MISSQYKPCFGSADDTDVCYLGLLPDELLLCIISHLEVTRGFLPDPEAESVRQEHNARTVRALHSMTLTCHKLHAITTPFLYTSFIQTQNHLDATKLLQTTLFRQPKLAKHIKYCEILTTRLSSSELPVSCGTSEWGTMASWLAAASWNIPGMGALFKRNKLLPWYEWSFEENESLLGALWQDFGSSHMEHSLIFPIILIITLADNLGEVAMCHDIFLSSALAFRRFSSSAGLRCVWLINRPFQQDAITTIKAQPTAHHSPLQDYIREHCTSFNIREKLRQHPSLSQDHSNSSAAISELSLDIYDMNSRFICGHLERCNALTRVSINWISHSTTSACYSYGERAQPIDIKPPDKPIELAVIGQALRKFTSTLQSLRVDTLDSGWLVDMETDIPALGSFRDFSRLANLEVSGLALWGDYNSLEGPDERLSSLLPPSITSLSIRTEWDDDVEHSLHMLLPDCTELLPNLKRVECSWRPAPVAIADYLVMAFQEQGVDLILDASEE